MTDPQEDGLGRLRALIDNLDCRYPEKVGKERFMCERCTECALLLSAYSILEALEKLPEAVRGMKAHHKEWHPDCQRADDIDRAMSQVIRAQLPATGKSQDSGNG
jgi:hypothetical protein